MVFIEIRPVGAVLTTDKDGFIASQSSVEKMQPKWRSAADEVVKVCRWILGEHVHSIYVRGSASRGEAMDGISDLDMFVVVKEWPVDELRARLAEERRMLERKYPFCDGIETSLLLLERVMSGQARNWILLKTYAACLYGEDLTKTLPGVKPGCDMVLHAFHVEREIAERIQRIEAGELRFTTGGCTWMMKRLLRSGAELVMEREQAYARDLYPCYTMFTKYYPDKEPQMKQVLELALNPTDDLGEVKGLAMGLAEWIEEEVKQVYG